MAIFDDLKNAYLHVLQPAAPVAPNTLSPGLSGNAPQPAPSAGPLPQQQILTQTYKGVLTPPTNFGINPQTLNTQGIQAGQIQPYTPTPIAPTHTNMAQDILSQLQSNVQASLKSNFPNSGDFQSAKDPWTGRPTSTLTPAGQGKAQNLALGFAGNGIHGESFTNALLSEGEQAAGKVASFLPNLLDQAKAAMQDQSGAVRLPGAAEPLAHTTQYNMRMASGDMHDSLAAIERFNANQGNANYMINQGSKDENFIRQMAADYISKDLAKSGKANDVAQELVNRIRVDQHLKPITLDTNAPAPTLKQSILHAFKDERGSIKLGPGEETPTPPAVNPVESSPSLKDSIPPPDRAPAEPIVGKNLIDSYKRLLAPPEPTSSLGSTSQDAINNIEQNNLKPAAPPTVGEPAIPIEQAAKNARYAVSEVTQNIKNFGETAALSAKDALRTPEETEAFRQAAEHPERLDATLQKVSNPQTFQKALGDFHSFTENVYNEYNRVSSPQQQLGFIKNFYSHLIDTSNPETQSKLDDFLAAKLRNYSGWFSKERVFADIDELRKNGFDLKNKSVPEDIMQYAEGTAKGAGANAFVSEMQKTHPGDVMVMNRDTENVPLRAGFQQLDPQNKYGMQGTFVSRDLAPHVTNAFTPSALAGNKVVKVADQANQLVKSIELGLGGFHAFKTTVRAAVNSPTAIPRAILNAVSPEARLAFRQGAIEDGTLQAASKMGITLGQTGDLMREGASLADKISNLNPLEKFNQSLFGGLIDTYKLDAAKGIAKRFDMNDPAQLIEARRVGAQVNDMFGGLNYMALNRNKTVQQILRFGALAPDFNEGKLRQVASAVNLTDWSPSALYARKNVIGEAVVLGLIAEVGRKIATGNFDTNAKDFIKNAILNPSIPLPQQFNNPKNGKSQIANLPGSDISDVTRAASDPANFLMARGSAAVSLGTKLATGKDYYGNPLVDPYSGQQDNLVNRAAALAPSQLPIPVVQANKTSKNQQTLPTSVLNTVGFRVTNNPNDPKTIATNAYFQGLKTAAQGLDPNQLAIWNGIIHPTTKDSQGNPVIDKNAYTSPDKYETFLANPKILAAEQAFQQSQPNHDPLWDWTSAQQRAYMQAQVISKNDPGGDKATTTALYAVVPQQLFNQRTQYFNSLASQGVLSPPTTPQAPKMPQDISDFWNKEKSLPYGTGARTAILQTPEGQKALAFLTTQQNFTNAQRADMGLPLLTASTSSGGSSKGGFYSTAGMKKLKYALKKTTLKTAKVTKPSKKKGSSYKTVTMPKINLHQMKQYNLQPSKHVSTLTLKRV